MKQKDAHLRLLHRSAWARELIQPTDPPPTPLMCNPDMIARKSGLVSTEMP